ncbi:hypothetical protein ACFLR1_04960 [Bacteroidota bacterium]
MIRRSRLTATIVAFLFAGSTFAQVSVSTSIPATALPGGDFSVEISVSKGDVSGFAKIQQILPAGLIATPYETEGATFSFKENKVKFLWMSLPNKNFKVSYKVKVDPSVSGNQIIEGSFAYIKGNETEKFIIPKEIIAIQNDQAQEIQREAINNVIASQKAKEDVAETARLQAEQDAAQIEETTEEPVEQIAQAEEEVLDEVEELITSPVEEVAEEAIETIEEVAPIEETAEIIEDVVEETDETAEVIEETPIEVAAVEEAAIEETTIEETAVEVNDEVAEIEETFEDVPEEIVEEPAEEITATQAPDYSDAMLTSKAGLVYRVQLAAGPNKIDPSYFVTKYDVSDPVVIEEHDGLFKYVIGEFGSYRPAKTFSNELRDHNNVEGSFVTAYSNGKRIDVQEALNIAGQ